jgi:hypothetical protein
MTRKDIERDYEVKDGVIKSLGKFEGEPVYSPYFYDAVLDGCSDDDENGVTGFVITKEDRAEFPELRGFGVLLTEDGNGFIYTEEADTEKDYRMNF